MKTAKITTKATIADFDSDGTGDIPLNKFSSSVAFKKMSVSDEKNKNATNSGNRYLQDVDTDLTNIFLTLQGRVRFGDIGNGARGENMSGEYRTFTTSTADTEVVVPHTLNAVPTGRIVVLQNKAGSLYNSSTAWTDSNIYVKCDTASVTFSLFLLK